MEAATWEAINAGLIDIISSSDPNAGQRAMRLYREQSGWRRSREFLSQVECLSQNNWLIDCYFAELQLNALIGKEACQLPRSLDVEAWLLDCLEEARFKPILREPLPPLAARLFRRLPALEAFAAWLLNHRGDEPDWSQLSNLPEAIQAVVEAGKALGREQRSGGASVPARRELQRLLDPTRAVQVSKIEASWVEGIPAGDELLTLTQRWSRPLANRALGAAMLSAGGDGAGGAALLSGTAFLPPPLSLQVRSTGMLLEPFEPHCPEQQALLEVEGAALHALRQLHGQALTTGWLETQLNRIPVLAERNAGLLLVLALQGRLAAMAWAEEGFALLARKESVVTAALLLGLAVDQLGSMDLNVMRLIALHLPAYNPLLLRGQSPPAMAHALEVQQAAVLAHGLLHCGTRDAAASQYLWRLLTRPKTPPSLLLMSGYCLGLVNYPQAMKDQPLGLSGRQLAELKEMAVGLGVGVGGGGNPCLCTLPAQLALGLAFFGSKERLPPKPAHFSQAETLGYELMQGLISHESGSLGGRLVQGLLHMGKGHAPIPPAGVEDYRVEWTEAVEISEAAFIHDFELLAACLSHAGSGNEQLIKQLRQLEANPLGFSHGRGCLWSICGGLLGLTPPTLSHAWLWLLPACLPICAREAQIEAYYLPRCLRWLWLVGQRPLPVDRIRMAVIGKRARQTLGLDLGRKLE